MRRGLIFSALAASGMSLSMIACHGHPRTSAPTAGPKPLVYSSDPVMAQRLLTACATTPTWSEGAKDLAGYLGRGRVDDIDRALALALVVECDRITELAMAADTADAHRGGASASDPAEGAAAAAESLVKSLDDTGVAGATQPHRFTKAAFRQAVIGKTKEEVRDLLGPPSNVIEQQADGVEHWYYWPTVAQIYDQDAGIVLSGAAGITFSLETGVVIGVSF